MDSSEEDGFEIAAEIIEDIKTSSLGSAEKVLLSVEWILREYRPNRLHDMEPSTIRKNIEQCLERHFAPDYIKSALSKVKEVFSILEEENVLTLLIALAYFMYIDGEFVYDREMREEMLAKEKELGFSVSKIKRIYAKWAKAFGDPAKLFEKIT